MNILYSFWNIEYLYSIDILWNIEYLESKIISLCKFICLFNFFSFFWNSFSNYAKKSVNLGNIYCLLK